MKLSLCYNNKFLIIIFVILYSFSVFSDDKIDEKVKKLTLELRCMTCQNQSIYDSEAEFSKDIKKIVKAKFKEGKTEFEIKKFLAERYGEYILFRPLLNYKNLFLWAFPFILLVFSLYFIIYKMRKK